MIKKDVTFVNFNDEKETETFWFHISKSNLTDHMVRLKPKFEDAKKRLEGEKKELTIEDVYLILDLIKEITKLAYGERSEDGKRFRQTEEVWQNFRDSAAYDALLTGFMEDPASGMEFMQAVMPKDLIEQATNELAFADGNVPAAVGTDVSVAQAVFPQEPAKPNPLAGLSQEEIANLVAQAQAK
jgi:hypothetical protein